MPYIKNEERKRFDGKIAILVDALQNGNANASASAGDINYVITEILGLSLDIGLHPKWEKVNTAMGILDCVGKELYRRLAGPYEDRKIIENGDVSVYKTFKDNFYHD